MKKKFYPLFLNSDIHLPPILDSSPLHNLSDHCPSHNHTIPVHTSPEHTLRNHSTPDHTSPVHITSGHKAAE
ncbi:hypothetical protein Bca52824_065856 [Brassica carinata]|uniref:Uncharacterized protein n=1 Tax=Brassica carinata TaxID=52824 RepID=A0A8X7QJA7_BRACI|nr:hypothetical protein Bca52824_065856 [Brassica carinata]